MTIPNEYDLGQTVTLTATFKNEAGTPTDPTGVTLTIIKPDETSVSHVYGTSPDLVKTGTGVYKLIYSTTLVGTHFYRWVATGTIDTAYEFGFTVRPSAFD